MWIVRLALRRPYTFVGDGDADRHPRRAHDRAHAHRHLPRHRHPGHLGHLALQRAVAGGDGETHRHQLRARPDDDRQRHRAHREPVAQRRRYRRASSRSSSSRTRRSRRRRPRSRPSPRPCSRCCRRGRRRRSSSATARRTSPSCSSRSSATRSASSSSSTTAQLHPHRPRDRAGRADAAARTAASSARSWSTSTPPGSTRGAVAARRDQRHQRAERHPADGDGEDRGRRSTPSTLNSAPTLLRAPQRHPGATGRPRHDGLRARRRAGARRLSRRRPTWCTSDGRRSASAHDPQDRRAHHARHRPARPRRAAAHPGHAAEGAARSRRCSTSRSSCARRRTACVKEAAIAAALTGLMILLFLGSWREHAHRRRLDPALDPGVDHRALGLGQTLNVDDAGRHGAGGRHPRRRRDGRDREHPPQPRDGQEAVTRAILDGAQQIAMPAFVSTLCICIVFVPVVFITGAAKSLFTPLAMAVVFAMLTSYFLSRTARADDGAVSAPGRSASPPARPRRPSTVARSGPSTSASTGTSSGSRAPTAAALAWALAAQAGRRRRLRRLRRWCRSALPAPRADFFPTVDAGPVRLHVRAPAGTRIEETEARFAEVEDGDPRGRSRPDEIETIIDNIGIPDSGINLSLSDASIVSAADGEILVALNGASRADAGYVARLRTILRERFPDSTFFFLAGRHLAQVLNFGLPAPIDVQVVGRRTAREPGDRARTCARRIGAGPRRRRRPPCAGRATQPSIDVDVDRRRARQLGFTERDVASEPARFARRASHRSRRTTGSTRRTACNTSSRCRRRSTRMDTIDALNSTPVIVPGQTQPQLLSNVASHRAHRAAEREHHPLQRRAGARRARPTCRTPTCGPVVRRRSSASSTRSGPTLPRGTFIAIRGQVESMAASLHRDWPGACCSRSCSCTCSWS